MRTAIVFTFAVVLGGVVARERAPAAPRALRICADPGNMPFSNRAGEGFENKIAAIIGRDLHRPVEYTWWLERRNYVRNTLDSGRCDAIIGFPAAARDALTTAPYYASTYVFVHRRDRNLKIRSFDDPALRKLRIGVQITDNDYTPPGIALGRRGLRSNIVGFRLYGDEGEASKIMDAVVNGAIDLAVVWGPMAGYYAKKSRTPLTVEPVSPRRDGTVPFTFPIAAAVRKGNRELEQEIDAALRRNRSRVNAVLASYGVPLVSGVPSQAELGGPGARRRSRTCPTEQRSRNQTFVEPGAWSLKSSATYTSSRLEKNLMEWNTALRRIASMNGDR